jgi:hypothetical protein
MDKMPVFVGKEMIKKNIRDGQIINLAKCYRKKCHAAVLAE